MADLHINEIVGLKKQLELCLELLGLILKEREGAINNTLNDSGPNMAEKESNSQPGNSKMKLTADHVLTALLTNLGNHPLLQRIRQGYRQNESEIFNLLNNGLRNVLTPIDVITELMSGQAIDQAQYYWACHALVRNLGLMSCQLDDFQEIMTLGQEHLKHEKVDLHKVLFTAIETVSKLINLNEEYLTNRIPRQPLILYGDSARLIQIFTTFIYHSANNAIPPGEIELKSELNDGMATVSIKNDGIGWPDKHQPRALYLFPQEYLQYGVYKESRLIGLPLIKKLIELHRGHLSLQGLGYKQGFCITVGMPKHESELISEDSAFCARTPLN